MSLGDIYGICIILGLPVNFKNCILNCDRLLTLHHADVAFCSMEEYISHIPHLLCHSLSLPAPEKKKYFKKLIIRENFHYIDFQFWDFNCNLPTWSCHEIEKLFTGWTSDHHWVKITNPLNEVLPINIKNLWNKNDLKWILILIWFVFECILKHTCLHYTT